MQSLHCRPIAGLDGLRNRWDHQRATDWDLWIQSSCTESALSCASRCIVNSNPSTTFHLCQGQGERFLSLQIRFLENKVAFITAHNHSSLPLCGVERTTDRHHHENHWGWRWWWWWWKSARWLVMMAWWRWWWSGVGVGGEGTKARRVWRRSALSECMRPNTAAAQICSSNDEYCSSVHSSKYWEPASRPVRQSDDNTTLQR